MGSPPQRGSESDFAYSKRLWVLRVLRIQRLHGSESNFGPMVGSESDCGPYCGSKNDCGPQSGSESGPAHSKSCGYEIKQRLWTGDRVGVMSWEEGGRSLVVLHPDQGAWISQNTVGVDRDRDEWAHGGHRGNQTGLSMNELSLSGINLRPQSSDNRP